MLLLCFNIWYHSFISSIELCSSSRNIRISDDGQKPYHCTNLMKRFFFFFFLNWSPSLLSVEELRVSRKDYVIVGLKCHFLLWNWYLGPEFSSDSRKNCPGQLRPPAWVCGLAWEMWNSMWPVNLTLGPRQSLTPVWIIEFSAWPWKWPLVRSGLHPGAGLQPLLQPLEGVDLSLPWSSIGPHPESSVATA